MRAETLVTESGKPDSFIDFSKAVGVTDYTDFAGYLMEDSYLDISSNSLDSLTFTGTITRGEFIYTLVQHYFEDINKNTDIKASKITDTKNGGNIA